MDELVRISTKIIEEYYNNNLEPFFEYMDYDVVWMGPATTQYIEGKDNLIDAYKKEKNNLKFKITNLVVKRISVHSTTTAETLARFTVYTYYPDGFVSKFDQRITILWKYYNRQKPEIWRYKLMHISNGMEIDSEDGIYQLHTDGIKQADMNNYLKKCVNKEHIFIVKSFEGSYHYVDYNDILYVNSNRNKIYDMHTKNGVIHTRITIDALIDKLSPQFISPRRNYVVNVMEIVEMDRKTITLSDGTVLPIPAVKYKQIKNTVNSTVLELTKDHIK